MAANLPKDHAFLERPYSGKAILYTMLRSNPSGVRVKDYFKALKESGRKITALPRVIYWVGLAVEEYGYDLLTSGEDKDGNPETIALTKREGGARPAKKAKKEKKTSKHKSSKSKSKSSSKKEKPVKKTSKKSSSKKTSKKKEESESESSESKSASESESGEASDESLE